jgi:hypothetical protein
LLFEQRNPALSLSRWSRLNLGRWIGCHEAVGRGALYVLLRMGIEALRSAVKGTQQQRGGKTDGEQRATFIKKPG